VQIFHCIVLYCWLVACTVTFQIHSTDDVTLASRQEDADQWVISLQNVIQKLIYKYNYRVAYKYSLSQVSF